jgi:SpoVK/Ycf46/Vps4 family AAA+-type ATPase
MSSFLGTTAKNIGNLFAFADRYNCVLLLDEFDAIAKLRNDPQEVGEVKRVVNTLLQCLDSRKDKGFTIGVTNHESLLDPAIWRRFDIQIEIPKPSSMVAISLLKKFLQPLEFADNEIKLFAWCIEDSTGADVEMLAKWIKRSRVIDKDMTIAHIIRQFALLNSGRIDKKREAQFSIVTKNL